MRMRCSLTCTFVIWQIDASAWRCRQDTCGAETCRQNALQLPHLLLYASKSNHSCWWIVPTAMRAAWLYFLHCTFRIIYRAVASLLYVVKHRPLGELWLFQFHTHARTHTHLPISPAQWLPRSYPMLQIHFVEGSVFEIIRISELSSNQTAHCANHSLTPIAPFHRTLWMRTTDTRNAGRQIGVTITKHKRHKTKDVHKTKTVLRVMKQGKQRIQRYMAPHILHQPTSADLSATWVSTVRNALQLQLHV
jgi:hypothetical protein